ncbi:interferon-induced protein with tetratricopeptide repeats 1 [Nothobranchius furzeri]|uniref:Interferon-induced protein with tetratricopeptide repeats 1-like n=1 Tax=Nothobranchius furzeri TaxID=105023 RepID=A0A1A7ZBB0_NOTFU|nr:interferon-induced protein with tetratricopeptide repeats 1 [Nothobranchius furzeri]KAF7202924.1 interferon-induced protein with tetratricopeptide repeats 1-like [Nothobranchius furzeri]
MSSAQSQTGLWSKLEVLECHFTWDLAPSRSRLLRLRDELEDIGSEEGYCWLGHIYNLQGFVHCQLGFVKEALRFFCRAAEAFRQLRNTVSDEGPWLVVNYGNLAWLHHHLGEQAQSQGYLSKLEALMSEYPSPCLDEPHPEICAEKAWTLMKFSSSEKLLAADYFQRAIRMQPDMVEWQTSRVLALVNAFMHQRAHTDVDILEKMKIAKEHDPDNLYLAALYLEARAQKGAKVQDEAHKLARRVLAKPVSSYSGIKPLLRLYRIHVSMDEAIDLAEEALERHPGARYIKRCAAICYKRKVFSQSNSHLEPSRMHRAISLHREVIALYPHSSLQMQTSLANIHAKLNQRAEAEEMFQELLRTDLDAEGEQMVCSYYAKYLEFSQKEKHRSVKYYMTAAAVPHQSFYREDSIRRLEKIREENLPPTSREVHEFLLDLTD